MSRKRLSKEAQRRLDIGTEMVATVLQQGGIPAIMIGMKPGDIPGRVDYFVVSQMDRKDLRHVLSRLARLFDGDIAECN